MMSDLITDEGDGAQQQFSLITMVDELSQHSSAQTEALKEKQKELSSLQASLLHIEKETEEAELKLSSKAKELLALEAEVQHLKLQTHVLHDRCESIEAQNAGLRFRISEEEESARAALAGFSAYRAKMEEHRARVACAESQTEAHKELEEKRELVRMLIQKKEELREDLENPNGNTLQTAMREVDALKSEIAVMQKNVDERRELLSKEFETQAQIKKDIEIQNRRYEAIVKRLSCQLKKAQAVHRQVSGDIYHMERKIAELKLQLEASQDSVVTGH